MRRWKLGFGRRRHTLVLSAGLGALAVVSILTYRALFSPPEATGSIYTTASDDSSLGSINPFEVTVIDGDTIKVRGRTIDLVGFDAPETGNRAQCPRERELGARATAQLKSLIAGGGLDLRLVPCACPPDTEGTPECNEGRSCGELRSYGRDIGGMMIQYVLAKPYVCSATSC